MLAVKSMVILAALSGANQVELWEFSADWCGACQQMEPTVARLQSAGVPLRKFNVDRHADLAKQYQVTRIPCFVVIAGGNEIDRIEGPASYRELFQKMVSSTVRNEQTTAEVVRGQSPRRSGALGRLVAGVESLRGSRCDCGDQHCQGNCRCRSEMGTCSNADCGAGSCSGKSVMGSGPPAEIGGDRQECPCCVPEHDPVAAALAATVRIKIVDNVGVSYGTGTVVDVHEDELLILTCGHVFRESAGNGKILCDLFSQPGVQDVAARVVSYDLRRDVGLVSMKLDHPVQVVPVKVGGAGARPSEKDEVFAVGCNHGEEPTIVHNKVIAVNRYHGPANLVVGGRPVNGRSGGGLFTSEGVLVGVCNAADNEEDEGLYAALGPIHAEFDAAGLGFIYRKELPAIAQVPKPMRSSEANTPRPAIRPAQPVSSPSELLPYANDPHSPEQLPAILDEAGLPRSTAQVICILRGPKTADGKDAVLVLEDPSADLIDRLGQELRQKQSSRSVVRGQSR